jgi:hypothetical protein
MIKLVVKTLRVGDVEDPEIYLGAVSYDWLQTDHGKYVKEKATDLTYNQVPFAINEGYYGYQYNITALFEDEEAVIYKLKFGDVK